MSDGTEKLCMRLYGKVKAAYYVGGSDAQMLHDAVKRIAELEAKLDAVDGLIGEWTERAFKHNLPEIEQCAHELRKTLTNALAKNREGR